MNGKRIRSFLVGSLIVTLTISCAQLLTYTKKQECLRELKNLQVAHQESKEDLRIEWARKDISTEEYKTIMKSWKTSEELKTVQCAEIDY